ncbi:MAG: dihydroorotate dehydrogenase electron transfer subunit [Patescibacteria group bacterium]|nr:dihydroorotate dehydrogenase electron transfer subunit [Patescibacteria group bacterium]
MLTIENAKIVTNQELTRDYFVMTLNCPKISALARPGQFVNIHVLENTDPLLRRPISIYDIDKSKGTIKILYFIKGKGTNILKNKKEEEILSVTGPHGNGFVVHPDSKNILLVGGGFGTAPLAFLAKEIKEKNIFTAIGGRTKDLIFCEKDFKDSGAKVFISTEDGSYGEKGLVTENIIKILNQNKIDEIFTVGPSLMMKAIAEIAKKRNIPCHVSLEERMACGVGACYGCVCKTKKGYETVCTQGPVFDSGELEW